MYDVYKGFIDYSIQHFFIVEVIAKPNQVDDAKFHLPCDLDCCGDDPDGMCFLCCRDDGKSHRSQLKN